MGLRGGGIFLYPFIAPDASWDSWLLGFVPAKIAKIEPNRINDKPSLAYFMPNPLRPTCILKSQGTSDGSG